MYETCTRLADAGHQVAHIPMGMANRMGIQKFERGIWIYPSGNTPFGEDVAVKHYAQFKADMLITIKEPWCFSTLHNEAINYVPMCVVGETMVQSRDKFVLGFDRGIRPINVIALHKLPLHNPLIEIETEECRTLKITSENLVATDRGWIPAEKLKKGDMVTTSSNASLEVSIDEKMDRERTRNIENTLSWQENRGNKRKLLATSFTKHDSPQSMAFAIGPKKNISHLQNFTREKIQAFIRRNCIHIGNNRWGGINFCSESFEEEADTPHPDSKNSHREHGQETHGLVSTKARDTYLPNEEICQEMEAVFQDRNLRLQGSTFAQDHPAIFGLQKRTGRIGNQICGGAHEKTVQSSIFDQGDRYSQSSETTQQERINRIRRNNLIVNQGWS